MTSSPWAWPTTTTSSWYTWLVLFLPCSSHAFLCLVRVTAVLGWDWHGWATRCILQLASWWFASTSDRCSTPLPSSRREILAISVFVCWWNVNINQLLQTLTWHNVFGNTWSRSDPTTSRSTQWSTQPTRLSRRMHELPQWHAIHCPRYQDLIVRGVSFEIMWCHLIKRCWLWRAGLPVWSRFCRRLKAFGARKICSRHLEVKCRSKETGSV